MKLNEDLTSKPKNETPLLYIDINLGEDKAERLVVFEGDCAKELSTKFCEDHGLDEETREKLEE